VANLVAQYVQSGNFSGTGTPKTVSVTTSTGDFLVILSVSSDYRQIEGNPSGGSLTYTSIVKANQNVSNLLNNVATWSAPASANTTFTMSQAISPNNSLGWGYLVMRFNNCAGIGNHASAQDSSGTTAPSVNITTASNDSSIVLLVSNFNQITGTRTYRQSGGLGTFTETESISSSSIGGVAAGYYNQVGNAGTYTIGMTAPTPQTWICIGIEVKTTSPIVSVSPQIIQSIAAVQNSYAY
jgi:hypothetical protein